MREAIIKLLRFIPDKLYLNLLNYKNLRRFINWREPETFSDKIQWLKVHDKREEYITLVDKFLVKEYIKNKIGAEYVIPLLQVYERPEDIDYSKLPEKFVLKTNHSGGNTGVVICRDKNLFDKERANKKLASSLSHNSYLYGREWPYKKIARRIIAEELLESASGNDLEDYKFYCFNGEPRLCQVIGNRNTRETIDFYDMEWNQIVGLRGLNLKAPNSGKTVPRPETFEEMKRIASRLSQNIPFARIDLYEVQGRCYFGEITLYPASGFGRFEPEEWNKTIGNWIKLRSTN